MAVLTASQLALLRRTARPGAAALGSIDFDKPTADAAFQAVEDWNIDGETSRPAGSLSQAINQASAPYTFSPDQKRELVAAWRYRRGARALGG